MSIFTNKHIPANYKANLAIQAPSFTPMSYKSMKDKLSSNVVKAIYRIEQLNPYCPEATKYGTSEHCLFEVIFEDCYGYEVNGQIFGVAYFETLWDVNFYLTQNLVKAYDRKIRIYRNTKENFKKFQKAKKKGCVGCFIQKMKNSICKCLGLDY